MSFMTKSYYSSVIKTKPRKYNISDIKHRMLINFDKKQKKGDTSVFPLKIMVTINVGLPHCGSPTG